MINIQNVSYLVSSSTTKPCLGFAYTDVPDSRDMLLSNKHKYTQLYNQRHIFTMALQELVQLAVPHVRVVFACLDNIGRGQVHNFLEPNTEYVNILQTLRTRINKPTARLSRHPWSTNQPIIEVEILHFCGAQASIYIPRGHTNLTPDLFRVLLIQRNHAPQNLIGQTQRILRHQNLNAVCQVAVALGGPIQHRIYRVLLAIVEEIILYGSRQGATNVLCHRFALDRARPRIDLTNTVAVQDPHLSVELAALPDLLRVALLQKALELVIEHLQAYVGLDIVGAVQAVHAIGAYILGLQLVGNRVATFSQGLVFE